MSNNRLNLENMTLEELWSLHANISVMLSARIKAERRELEKRLAILNRGIEPTGAATDSRYLEKKPRRAYPVVLPKYRNPQTSETWSGRGKRPRWLTAAMKSGHKIEEFRIRDAKGRQRA
jgi:DNA-binding protein H-NS